MAGLDFRQASDLFMGNEVELAQALGVSADDVRGYRDEPGGVPQEVMQRLGEVLLERGRGMMRVGEMLTE